MPWHALPTLPQTNVYIEFNFFFLHIIFIIIFLYKIWIWGRACSNSGHSSLIVDCKELICKFPSVQIKHCYREANQCAYRLAKSRAKLGQDFVVNGSPPMEINLLLFYEFPHQKMKKKKEWCECFQFIYNNVIKNISYILNVLSVFNLFITMPLKTFSISWMFWVFSIYL